jgi:hypothetical protein
MVPRIWVKLMVQRNCIILVVHRNWIKFVVPTLDNVSGL